ncbi:MAG: hypothetical protein L0Z62_43055 [Gemmataceae bacterium]|nr:hypothetical protein [Gemmataceae bacterium]
MDGPSQSSFEVRLVRRKSRHQLRLRPTRPAQAPNPIQAGIMRQLVGQFFSPLEAAIVARVLEHTTQTFEQLLAANLPEEPQDVKLRTVLAQLCRRRLLAKDTDGYRIYDAQAGETIRLILDPIAQATTSSSDPAPLPE